MRDLPNPEKMAQGKEGAVGVRHQIISPRPNAVFLTKEKVVKAAVAASKVRT